MPGNGLGEPTMKQFFYLLRDESGPTSTEYAVLLAAVLVVCMVSILGFGETAMGMLQSADHTVTAATSGLDMGPDGSSPGGSLSWLIEW